MVMVEKINLIKCLKIVVVLASFISNNSLLKIHYNY